MKSFILDSTCSSVYCISLCTFQCFFFFFPKLKRIFSQVHHKMLVNAVCGDKTKKETETKTIFSISRLSSVWKKSSDVPALSESWAVTSLLKHYLFQRFLQPRHVQSLSSLVAHQCIPHLCYLSGDIHSEMLSFIYAVMHTIFSSLEYKPREVRGSVFLSPDIFLAPKTGPGTQPASNVH